MTDQEQALVTLADLLDDRGIPYMVIGGLANAVWVIPRATLDVNVTIWTEPAQPEEAIPLFDGPFRIRPSDPRTFVRETRVLPLESPSGVRVDVIFGLLPFEAEAIRRGVPREVAGRPVRFCSAEDLILLKIVSDRPRDQADVQGILARRRSTLDRTYLDPRIDELASLLDRREIREAYERGLREQPKS